jgi:glycosyltransferase involved in cell wall biosynthesis
LESELKIAVPWSLSHYIPLNGFHPLYRALFDHAPPDINLAAWDNVKLHRHFLDNPTDRHRLLDLANSYQREIFSVKVGTVAHSHASHFYPPDRVLTEALEGEVEFHHTAPFPSLTRPFVLHCESFAPLFFPEAQRGQDRLDKRDELRQHYRRLFESPLCHGIYSHIPETLDSFRTFFSSPVIERKLFESRIGLSQSAVKPGLVRPRQPADRPRFLFISSAGRGPADFFNRGGHIVLRFWKEFRGAGRAGTLILRCGRPDDDALTKYGVDSAFIQSEAGRSIIWAEGYLSNQEISALMADAHFYLLPSASLHSVSILLAMTLGTVPVVTDTVGTSVYVTDREAGIVLKGVKDEVWNRDPDSGVLADQYERTPNVAASLVTQLVERLFALLDSKDAWYALSNRASERARTRFSGEAFASEFWEAVVERAKRARHRSERSSAATGLTHSLRRCSVGAKKWATGFENSAQPVLLLDTGVSRIFELGGAAVQMFGSPSMALTDWSVFARYFEPLAPKTSFANSLVDLDPYLSVADNEGRADARDIRDWASSALIPFPTIHSLASRGYRLTRRGITVANRLIRFMQYKRTKSGGNEDLELVMENVHGFSIVRFFYRFYAIPRGEGPFIVSKVERRLYSETFCAYSLARVVSKVNRSKIGHASKIANGSFISSIFHRFGRRSVSAPAKLLKQGHVAPYE